jgi:SAM-dependent methyltransferase
MENPDDIWRQIVLSEGKDSQLVDDLRIALVKKSALSKLFVILQYVKQLTKEEKSIRILDYGCGGGQLLTYLRILGYKNVIGIDVGSLEANNKLNTTHRNMGFKSDVFFSYDGTTSLPFNNSSFDIIISQQVLEHVHNVEQYLFECRRVLDDDGKILLDFPHRVVPFDTHTQMWFVHYFPITIRRYFYNKYRNNNAQKYADSLNLRPIWFYKTLLNKMFSSTIDMTCDRIGVFAYKDNYEGSIRLRVFFDKLMSVPLVGRYVKKILSIFANATLVVTK